MKIALVYDLRSDYLREGYSAEQVAEFDSDATIDALDGAIRALGHETDRVGHARALARRLAAGDRWDLVFNIAEGLSGRNRESQVPCLLEIYGIPCTFSDALVCGLTLDKAMAKRVVAGAGLRTPAFAVVDAPEELGPLPFGFPVFVKPVAEGTGKGVDGRSRADNAADLAKRVGELVGRFHQPVLVEEYLPGREFTTAILGSGRDARVLGTMEIVVKAGAPAQDYSFEVKELCEEHVEYRRPGEGPLRKEVEELALAAYRVLECRDTGRVDIRLDRAGRASFIEINPLPGLHPSHSDLPMIATMEGMPYETLIGEILRSAMNRVSR